MYNTLLLLLLLVLLLLSEYTNAAANFQRFELTERNADAVCNDGSSAVYFVRPGTGTGASIWTIYLEGGGWCYDSDSCAQRHASSPHFMTSKLLPLVLNDTIVSRDVNHGGINSASMTVNPRFYNVNQVYLWYCSSDEYSGNRSNAAGGWQFKGKVIIETLIKDLAFRNKETFLSAKHVLLLGFSAGALGAMNNADYVGGLVKSVIPSVTYKTYIDSGWYFDAPLFSPTGVDNRYVVQHMLSEFGMQYNENCVQVFRASNETWRCGFPVHTYPHITTPIFVAGYEYDSPFVGSTPNTDAGREYSTLMRRVFLRDTAPLKNLLAPNCFLHGLAAYDSRWAKINVGGWNASESVWLWLTGQQVSIRHTDECEEMNCNPSCAN